MTSPTSPHVCHDVPNTQLFPSRPITHIQIYIMNYQVPGPPIYITEYNYRWLSIVKPALRIRYLRHGPKFQNAE